MSQTYVVIVAGGKGTRMGNAIPKQFLPLNGKPVLYYTLAAFKQALPGIQLILVLPSEHISYAQMILKEFPEGIDLTIVSGGSTRFESVKNGLLSIADPQEPDVVMVHDGVRALIKEDLIVRCWEAARNFGSAIPVVPVADSMRQYLADGSHAIAERSNLRIVQTPQAFNLPKLLKAFQQEYTEQFTDEASVIEAAGESVQLIEGQSDNLKITTPTDLLIAAGILQYRYSNED